MNTHIISQDWLMQSERDEGGLRRETNKAIRVGCLDCDNIRWVVVLMRIR